jgi:fibronectin-binding autotransporter adhesin
VATGDVNGDGVYDIITGPGRGSTLEVQVFDGNDGTLLSGQIGHFLAYDARFRGGVFVASGDVNGDGFDDVITAPGPGTTPIVRVISGADGSEIESFLAFDAKFRLGLNVAAGDVNGDGRADLITGSGPGGIPQVRVFDGSTGKPFSGTIGYFLAYDATFRGGVSVAAGDVNGDGNADIITAPGPGRGTALLVRVFDALTSAELGRFLPYPAVFQGGVRVAAGDVTGTGEAAVITAPGPKREPLVRAFDALTSHELESFLAFEASSRRGVFVSASRRQ